MNVTPLVKLSISDSAFLNCRSAFILDNAHHKDTLISIHKCFFERNWRVISSHYKHHFLKITESRFYQNNICFQLNNQEKRLAPKAHSSRHFQTIKSDCPQNPHEKLPFKIQIRRCDFQRNETVANCFEYNNPFLFTDNLVKHSVGKALVFQGCRDVSVSTNRFESNYIDELFKPDFSKPQHNLDSEIRMTTTDSLQRKVEERRHVLRVKSNTPRFVTLETSNSHISIKDNIFSKNHGMLIKINEHRPLLNRNPELAGLQKVVFNKNSEKNVISSFQKAHANPMSIAKRSKRAVGKRHKRTLTQPYLKTSKSYFRLTIPKDKQLPLKLRRATPKMKHLKRNTANRKRPKRAKSNSRLYSYVSILDGQSSPGAVMMKKVSQLKSSNTSLIYEHGKPKDASMEYRRLAGFKRFSDKFKISNMISQTNEPRAKTDNGDLSSLGSGFARRDSGAIKEEYKVDIDSNKMEENQACCINLTDSIRNSKIEIKNNTFKTNFLDIVAGIVENRNPVSVFRNFFEMAPDAPEKTIKIKHFKAAVVFKENEFSKQKVMISQKRRGWLGLIGCGDSDQLSVINNEMIQFGTRVHGRGDQRRKRGRSQSNPQKEEIKRKELPSSKSQRRIN